MLRANASRHFQPEIAQDLRGSTTTGRWSRYVLQGLLGISLSVLLSSCYVAPVRPVAMVMVRPPARCWHPGWWGPWGWHRGWWGACR